MNLHKDKAAFRVLLSQINQQTGYRLDGIPGVSLDEFVFFFQSMKEPHILEAYETMQNQYIFQKADRISTDAVVSQLMKLANLLEII